ncbi:MAG: DMT family transporter [Gammaproteobacteria bacterium]|nr:DMT family transporter [Gammaproteobacteria bacterium]MBT8435945.1 DMT family transporter [Gammaproteobacteria bacterium]
MTYLTTLNRNTQGILCLVAALAFLTISDSIIKWLSTGLPLHEIMLFRGIFAMFLVFVFVYLEGGLITLKTRRPVLHFIRGSMLVLANMFFFLGLAVMPLAETVSLFYTAPLFICILSQPVLGEKVGLLRWLVIIAGLIGVIIMLRPGSEVFRSISLLPVLAALSYAVMTMMTRKLGMREKASALTFYIQLAFILISSIVGLAIGDGRFDIYANETTGFLLRAWRWPDLAQLQLLLLCGVMVAFGGYLISQAYRLGEAAAVAPFEYASLPFALLVGFYLWGDWPDWISFIGSGLIIFSGLLVLYLENLAHKKLHQHAQIDY